MNVRVIHEFKCLKKKKKVLEVNDYTDFISLAYLRHVFSHMCPQNTWLWARKLTLQYCNIGCIFLVYLHCVASSVSLNGQLEKMHSCTGCNWKVFRHYAFSNVGSKHFDKCMHSHTGHICMAFPLCFIKCVLKCQLIVFYLWEFVNGKSPDFQNNILFTHLYLSISVYVHCAFSDLFSELSWNHSCCTQMAFA